jgi:hypothetical protein
LNSASNSPRYLYFFRGEIGVGQFGNIYVSIDIPFKGSQGRSNRSSTVHTMSLTLHSFLNFFTWHRRFAHDFLFSKSFENYIVRAVSMTAHAF